MASKAIAKVDETENQITVFAGLEELAGEGFSEVTAADQAIPFLRILAQLSPQVLKRDGAYVDGAEAGMIYNTVLNEAYNGEEGIQVIPVHYNRRFVEWTPREKGGGYIGSYDPTDAVVATTTRSDRGEDMLPNGNTLSNTAQFFVLLLHPTLGSQRALITMSSTQLKKARKWVTQMQSLTAQGENGKFVLPMMSQVYRLITVEERNDKGSWFGWEITRERGVDLENKEEKETFDMAVAFARSVKAGDVQIKTEEGDQINTESDDSVM
jgi:hypothetical protein